MKVVFYDGEMADVQFTSTEKSMKIVPWLFAFAFLAVAQEPLNNDSIMKMVKAGLGEGLIANMIQSQPGKYSLTPDDLVKLKQQGVSEKVLEAMLSKSMASPASGAVAPTSGALADSDIPPDIEIGAYYKKAGKWEQMLPE